MTNKRNIAIAVFAVLLCLFWIVSQGKPSTKQHLILELMTSLGEIEERSTNFETPNIAHYSKILKSQQVDTIQDYEGAVSFHVQGFEFTSSDALVTYYSNAGYVRSFDILEFHGQYTAEEFADKYIEIYQQFENLPDWLYQSDFVKEQNMSSDLPMRDNLLSFLKAQGEGFRKISLLTSDNKFIKNGGEYVHSLDINATYDADNPEHPYRFAFHLGLMAGSIRCLNEIGYIFIFDEFGTPDYQKRDPELLDVFADWDGVDVSDETLKPMIDKYVFERCDLNKTDW